MSGKIQLSFVYVNTDINEGNTTFYRLPKIIFTDKAFAALSMNEKVMYAILLERTSLSQKNGWIDEEGRVFIRYTDESLAEIWNCNINTARKYKANLQKAGLIELEKGSGRSSMIFVKKISINRTEDSSETICPKIGHE